MKINKYYTILIIALAASLSANVLILGQNNKLSPQEKYKLNADCSQKSINYAKDQSTELTKWNVLQSNFNSQEMVCYAEFYYINLGAGSTHEIFDLTHTKSISFLPEFRKDDDVTVYHQNAQDYEKVRSVAFEKIHN